MAESRATSCLKCTREVPHRNDSYRLQMGEALFGGYEALSHIPHNGQSVGKGIYGELIWGDVT